MDYTLSQIYYESFQLCFEPKGQYCTFETKCWDLLEKIPVSYCWVVPVIEFLRSGMQVQCSPHWMSICLKKIHGFSYLKTLPTEDECPRSHIWALVSLILPLIPTSLQLLREPCAHLRENCRFLDLRELPMKVTGFTCVYRRRKQVLFYCYINCSFIFPEIKFYDHFPPVLWVCTIGLI